MTPNGTSETDFSALKRRRLFVVTAIAAVGALGGCATTPINPPIAHADPNAALLGHAADRKVDEEAIAAVAAAVKGRSTHPEAHRLFFYRHGTSSIDSRAKTLPKASVI